MSPKIIVVPQNFQWDSDDFGMLLNAPLGERVSDVVGQMFEVLLSIKHFLRDEAVRP